MPTLLTTNGAVIRVITRRDRKHAFGGFVCSRDDVASLDEI